MSKNLLLSSVLILCITQTSSAAVNTVSNSQLTYSRENIDNSYGSSKNIYSTSNGANVSSNEEIAKAIQALEQKVESRKDESRKDESIISYKDTTTDELETYKSKSVTVMNNFTSVHPTLIMAISNSPSKNPKDSTVLFSPVLKGSTASCYRGCSLMVKFDDKEAKKYEFKSNITNNIYILNSSHNKDFINNVRNSKVLKTKISFATFNLPIEKIDFKKIDF